MQPIEHYWEEQAVMAKIEVFPTVFKRKPETRILFLPAQENYSKISVNN